MSLDGRVAVITGGARGIGQAIAAELARCGADVIFCDVCDAERASETLGLIHGSWPPGAVYSS